MQHVKIPPMPAASSTRARFADWPLALRSIAGFWLFYLGTVLLRALLGPEAASAMGFRVINALFGVALTLLIYAALALLARGGSVRRMAIVAAIAALPAAVVLSVVSLRVATQHIPMSRESSITTQEGVAIVQHGSNVRIVQQDGDELEVNLPPIEQIIAAKMPRLIADGLIEEAVRLARLQDCGTLRLVRPLDTPSDTLALVLASGIADLHSVF